MSGEEMARQMPGSLSRAALMALSRLWLLSQSQIPAYPDLLLSVQWLWRVAMVRNEQKLRGKHIQGTKLNRCQWHIRNRQAPIVQAQTAHMKGSAMDTPAFCCRMRCPTTRTQTRTGTHTHTHTHTRRDTYTHTHIHTHIQTQTGPDSVEPNLAGLR